MLIIYRIFFSCFALPFLLVASAFSPKLRAGFKQKFGFYDFKLDEGKTLWIHAVSVGEVQVAANFIPQISDKYNIVLTTTTPQGQELAVSKLSSHCKQIAYFPYDYDFAVKSAIKAFNPFAILIVETEIWPTLAQIAHKQGIKLCIVNGRISESTYKSYKNLSFFFKKVLGFYHTVLTQSEDDCQRYIKIGANQDTTRSMGNIKFDLEKPKVEIKNEYQNRLKSEGKRVLIAGSTHKGEDEIILSMYESVKTPDTRLIIAPRHLERVKDIEKLLIGKKWGKISDRADFNTCEIIILDTTGELAKIYSIADFVIMGGSFNKTGGHNPLEASIWGKPVLSGQNIKNFKNIFKNLVELNSAKIVNDSKELSREAFKLLNQEEELIKMSKNCERIFEKNSGATAFLIDFLEKIS